MAKIILCGYHWAGCKALKILQEEGHDIFVFTHKNQWHIPSLINYCKELKINFNTNKINIGNLPFKPDIISSIFYRYIIDENVINSCDGKIFNLHPSLLPKYRGCGSLTWAMINGEKEVGFTYHYINKDIDSGNILYQKKIAIEDFDNQFTLYYRVMFEAMKSYRDVLKMVFQNKHGYPQKKELGTNSYYKRGAPFEGNINQNWDYKKTERFIRAMIHPPLPPANFKGNEIKTFDEYLKIMNKSNSKK